MGLRANYIAALLGGASGPLYDFRLQSTHTLLGNRRTGLGTRTDEAGLSGVYGPHNLLWPSDDVSGANWQKINAGTGVLPVVDQSAGLGPAGQSVCRVRFNGGAGTTVSDFSMVGVSLGSSQANRYSSRIFAKSFTGAAQTLMVYLGTVNGPQITVATVGDNWVDITPPTVDTTSAGNVVLYCGVRGTYGGARTIDVLISQVQINVGSLTEYVPTTTAPVFLPRIQCSATAPHVPLGTLLEPLATQLYHSHSLASPALVAQNTTVTAQPYTMQFVGSGTVTLSGAHTETVVGLGSGLRKTFTFTPSAGTLTSTASGTCEYPQLQAGSVADSYIPNPTTGSLVRSADGNWDITGAQFTELWGAGSERTIIVEWYDVGSAVEHSLVMGHVAGSVASEALGLFVSAANALMFHARAGGAAQASLNAGTINVGTLGAPARNKAAFRWGAGSFGVSLNGAAEVTGTGTIPVVTHLRISGAGLVAANDVHDILTALDARPTAITGSANSSLSAL